MIDAGRNEAWAWDRGCEQRRDRRQRSADRGTLRVVGTLYLIRHGQASYGEPDYDRLSPRGIEQALAVGRWAARQQMKVR